MSDFAALAANLGELKGLPSRISKRVADGISALMSAQFDAETDPYGNPWAPLLRQTIRRKGGDSRILRRTDKLFATVGALPSAGAGVDLSAEDYGQFHQGGTVNMVERPIFPDGDELPEDWSAVIDEAFEDGVDEVFRG